MRHSPLATKIRDPPLLAVGSGERLVPSADGRLYHGEAQQYVPTEGVTISWDTTPQIMRTRIHSSTEAVLGATARYSRQYKGTCAWRRPEKPVQGAARMSHHVDRFS